MLVRERLAVARRGSMHAAGLASLGASWALDAAALASLARARGAALIHSNTSVTLGGAPAARLARIPHLWHVREIYEGVRAWPAHRRLLLSADALACVSGATRAPLEPSRGRARVLYDGLAVPARPRSDAERTRIRDSFGVSAQDVMCLVAGRLSDWKGQDVLLRAVAAQGDPNVSLVAVLAGDAWPGGGRGSGARERLEALARELGIAGAVRMPGFRDDVADLYAAADIVVVPSTRPDPLPNAALEAAGAGRCLVASDHGGLPEIVRDGETGVLVAPGDPGALADALRTLALEPARRAALGAAAAADVCERFSAALLTVRVQGLYDELLGRRRP